MQIMYKTWIEGTNDKHNGEKKKKKKKKKKKIPISSWLLTQIGWGFRQNVDN